MKKTLLVLLFTVGAWTGPGSATELHAFPQPVVPPPLAAPDLAGSSHSLDGLRGKVVLVNFWASWCRPCLAEMPSMQRLFRLMKGRPFALLAVNVEESKATVWRFRKLLQPGFPTLLDTDGEVAREWRVTIYPTSYLIDPEGRIRYVARGALEWDEPEIIRSIETLMPAGSNAVQTGNQLSP
ncbi:MAG: TlpA disulfide reductase family protein [Thiogranum sp.]